MKQKIVIFIACLILLFSCPFASANAPVQNGFSIVFNGEVTDVTSIISDDTHYVPLRMIFQKMGGAVYYRSTDRQILALTRDGDIIRHVVGDIMISVNGERKIFGRPSVLENNSTYIPVEMVAGIFCPDRIWYDNQQLHINKTFATGSYYTVIQDVLDMSGNSNFYPERFQRYINFHVKKPSYTMQEVLFRVNLGLDFPFYENVTVIEQPYELLVLVNKYNQLPPGFTQYNLVPMSRAYTANDGRQYLLAGVAYEQYVRMADAARQDGISMYVVSAYRTEEYQRNLYNSKVRSRGKASADNYSARAGSSEHQTGLAVDINSTYVSFENSSAFRWLQKHAHEYGFIMRYPKGKEWITGYSYEPWHYRYVGTDVAKIIHEEGITYEEYYAKYISVNEFR